MSASDLQAQQWQSDMLAHLRGASNATEETPSGDADVDDSAYRPASDITAMAQRPRALHRTVSHRPAASRAARYVSLARAFIGGDSAPTAHADALTRLQTPVPTGRRVVVTGAHGGAGASTVALLLADAFHTYRPDGVVLLDASGHTGGLLSRLAQAPTMSVAGADKHLFAGDVAAVLKPHQHPARAVLTPSAEATVTERVATRLQRRVGVSVIDVGPHRPTRQSLDRPRSDDTSPEESARDLLIEGADAVVVACENTVRGLLCAHAAVADNLANGFGVTSIVVVIVERVTDSGITVKQARQEVQKSHRVAVAHIGHDRHLAGGAHLHSPLLGARTRYLLSALAADVIESSVAAR